MKNKKLIPFIMGCAMLAATSLSVHAAPITGNDSQDLNDFTKYADTNYNEQIFKTDSNDNTAVGNGTIDLSETGGSATSNYGERSYKKGGNDSSREGDTVDPDSITNLWTNIPTYELQVPARTVIPLGASKWNIGQVEIVNGEHFVNPDKVKVDVASKPMFLDGTVADTDATRINYQVKLSNDVSEPTVSDSTAFNYTGSDEKAQMAPTTQKHIYFYYDGRKGDTIPYNYSFSEDTMRNYDNKKMSDVNQGQHLWIHTNDWSNKEKGVYQGKLTFYASIESMETADIATNGDISAETPEILG